MVDDDGVSMSVDKAVETARLVLDRGRDSKLTVAEYAVVVERAGRVGRWAGSAADGVGGLKD